MKLDHDRCYNALASRDARFDGHFIAAVRTTRIYCRPSCPAITPKRGNVEFVPTAAAAQQRGYRACRRCLPDAVPGSPDWNTRADLAACTGAETVAILNDLQAQGHAVDHISDDNLRQLVPGPTGADHNAKLVVGIGTGFNAVPVFRTETGRYVPPCESGHVTFPVLSEDDMSLARFVSTAHGFPGVEDVLSGRGLERTYAWAGGETTRKDSSQIMAALEQGDDPVAIRAAEAFVQAMGRVTGDLALTHLPFGGIYLIGGMARALTPHLARFGFDEAFRAKGRFSDFMMQFAVWGVEDDFAALTGCAQHLEGLMAAGITHG